jgi:hypothetical protein
MAIGCGRLTAARRSRPWRAVEQPGANRLASVAAKSARPSPKIQCERFGLGEPGTDAELLSVFVVRKRGLEPPRPFGHRNLNAAPSRFSGVSDSLFSAQDLRGPSPRAKVSKRARTISSARSHDGGPSAASCEQVPSRSSYKRARNERT